MDLTPHIDRPVLATDRTGPLRERLAARYPLLYLVHADERDTLRLLADAAASTGLRLDAPQIGRQDPVTAAADAIMQLADRQEPVLLALPLGHLLLRDAGLTRLLAERLAETERQGHVIALLAPVRVACPELERDRVVMTVPLPGPGELEPMAAAALRAADGALDGDLLQRGVQALRGLTHAQARRSLRRVRQGGLQGAQAIAALQAEKRDLVAAGGVLEIIEMMPALAEVGGLEVLKSWLQRRRLALTREARAFGLPEPRGVLVVGVQGCGKSMIAKASAVALGVPLVRLDLGRLYTAERSPDENLREALMVAEAMAPVVLWLDEIDKAFADTASEAGGRVLASFLTWMGEARPGVFVAATANRIEHLPPELLRKGRFDETFFVDLPDLGVRADIFAIHLRKSGREPNRFDLQALALAAERLTGAEIEQTVTEALAVAFAEARELTEADLTATLSKTVPFVETYEAQVKALRDWARRRCRSAAPDRSLRELYLSANSPAP